MEDDLSKERDVFARVAAEMLDACSRDGSVKRDRGDKAPWWRDPTHEPAIFSHLMKWKRGELRDAESGAHPLAHAAWRMLAIAYQETYGQVDPALDTRWREADVETVDGSRFVWEAGDLRPIVMQSGDIVEITTTFTPDMAPTGVEVVDRSDEMTGIEFDPDAKWGAWGFDVGAAAAKVEEEPDWIALGDERKCLCGGLHGVDEARNAGRWTMDVAGRSFEISGDGVVFTDGMEPPEKRRVCPKCNDTGTALYAGGADICSCQDDDQYEDRKDTTPTEAKRRRYVRTDKMTDDEHYDGAPVARRYEGR